MFLKIIAGKGFNDLDSVELAKYLYENEEFESMKEALTYERLTLVEFAKNIWEEKGSPKYIYQEILNSAEAYSILDEALFPNYGTWNQGGCLILAQAFCDLFKDNGCVVSMMDKKIHKATHYAFKFNNGSIIDFDGVHANEKSWINSFCANEGLNSKNFKTTKFIKNPEVKCNISSSIEIAIMLKNSFSSQ